MVGISCWIASGTIETGTEKVNWNNLQRSSIILQLDSRTKTEAIRELLAKAPALRSVREPAALERAILSREKVMSTGIGRGVAFSHGEATDLPGISVAVGLSKEGIDFEALDGKPVNILFLIVNSRLKRAEYLEVLSTLTRLMRKEHVREKILCCTCSSDVEHVLQTASAG